ncbi:MAG TPA: hypothetical protein VIJ66_09720 [Solirubrobacteraceae bacterium]
MLPTCACPRAEPTLESRLGGGTESARFVKVLLDEQLSDQTAR